MHLKSSLQRRNCCSSKERGERVVQNNVDDVGKHDLRIWTNHCESRRCKRVQVIVCVDRSGYYVDSVCADRKRRIRENLVGVSGVQIVLKCCRDAACSVQIRNKRCSVGVGL